MWLLWNKLFFNIFARNIFRYMLQLFSVFGFVPSSHYFTKADAKQKIDLNSDKNQSSHSQHHLIENFSTHTCWQPPKRAPQYCHRITKTPADNIPKRPQAPQNYHSNHPNHYQLPAHHNLGHPKPTLQAYTMQYPMESNITLEGEVSAIYYDSNRVIIIPLISLYGIRAHMWLKPPLERYKW